MALPVLRRRKPEPVPDDLFRKAVGAVAKAYLQGQAGTTGKAPGTSWSNQGSINTALLARVTQNLASTFNRPEQDVELALAEHGLTWGPPFPPRQTSRPVLGHPQTPAYLELPGRRERPAHPPLEPDLVWNSESNQRELLRGSDLRAPPHQ